MIPNIMAQALSVEKTKELIIQTQKFYDSMDKMTVTEIANLTYPALYTSRGSKEEFTKQLEMMRNHHLKKGGFKVIQSELGKPSKIIIMGDEEVVFIPRICSLDQGESILKKETYAIAIRSKVKGGAWYFIDGDFFGPDPKSMFGLLTALPKDTKLPHKNSERIKKDDKTNKTKKANKSK